MGILADMLARLSNEAATDYGHRYVGTRGSPITPDEEYVRVWLRSSRISNVRRWAQKFYPTVHARFVHADPVTGMREVMSVSSPTKTFQELDSRHLDRFIVVNQSLLGPIPYRGELVSEIALFSVVADNLAKPYLDLLSELTASTAGSFLGAVEPLIAPLKRGAEVLLLDSGRAELEIGLARTDAELVAGNIVVARTEKGGPGLNGLRLDKDDYRLLDANGEPVADFPYMVIGIERLRERPDYRNIPEIRTGWKRILNAASKGEPSATVVMEFQALLRAINFSPDLVRHDRRRVIGILAEELRQAGFSLDGVAGLPAPAAAVRSMEGALEGCVPPPLPERIAVLSAWDPIAGGRISLSEARRMIIDPEVPETVVRQLLIFDPNASRPFAPAVRFNPDVVAVATPEIGLEGAQLLNWANELAQWRRHNQFFGRINVGDPRPVLVAVGDSWFQFPIFLDDVIDQLGSTYTIWSLDAAGDTLANMIVQQKRHIAGLKRWRDRAKALLVSGSGNDIVGEDPDGVSVLTKILRPFAPDKPPQWYLETGEFERRLKLLEDCFDRLFTEVASQFPGLPILCHGYDHAIPARPGDPRHPPWARQDQWLTGPMSARLGIRDPDLRRSIVRLLIDKLNEMQISLCGGNRGGKHANAWHIDARGAVPDALWADELHPHDDGFASVSRRFKAVLHDALGAGAIVASAGTGIRGAGQEEALEGVTDAVLARVFNERAQERASVIEVQEAPDGAVFVERPAMVPGTASLAQLPTISARAYDLIVEHETGGRYYESVYKKRPVWPKGNSGITIGFGYDLGYVTAEEFERDWAELPRAIRSRLAATLGRHAGNYTAAEMRRLLQGVRNIQIEWDAAEKVFRNSTLPKFIRATVRALDNTDRLSPDSFGALVSLTFNRGAAYRKQRDPRDPLDRYREMRGIGAAMTARRFADVPGLIRLMKRIWRGTDIEAELLRRRDDEAVLFEAGLRES